MKKLIIFFAVLAFFSIKNQAQTVVTDTDGNVYDTVHIGTQVWLQQNLATTRYNDGTQIPLVTDNSWYNLTTPAYCWFYNDSTTYKSESGALYNWYTVNTGKLCPVGWHVPTDFEWYTLVKYIDPNAAASECYCEQSDTAGYALKAPGDVVWCNGNPLNDANNSSRFTAVGGGYRSYNCDCFAGHPAGAYFWTSSPHGTYGNDYTYYLSCGSNAVWDNIDFPTVGYSVRCVQDITTGGINEVKNNNWLVFYPNPSKDFITVENIEHTDAVIEISGMDGQFITSLTLKADKTNIDVTALTNGIYVVEMRTKTGVAVKKFVKE